MIIDCLFVGFGGFLGAISRYLMCLLPLKPENGFPLVTLLVNVIGAFAIGLITALAVRNRDINPQFILFLRVGICGGFTTFSTFSLETAAMFQSGSFFLGVLYVSLSVLLCTAAVIGAGVLVR